MYHTNKQHDFIYAREIFFCVIWLMEMFQLAQTAYRDGFAGRAEKRNGLAADVVINSNERVVENDKEIPHGRH